MQNEEHLVANLEIGESDYRLECVNETDGKGHPAGGWVEGVGVDINWQKGPLGLGEKPTGAFVEKVITAVIQRLEYYQDSKFNCVENAHALFCLHTALGHLYDRTNRRERAGIEGTYETQNNEDEPGEVITQKLNENNKLTDNETEIRPPPEQLTLPLEEN